MPENPVKFDKIAILWNNYQCYLGGVGYGIIKSN